MGLVNLDRVNASLLLKYSECAILDPYNVSGSASMALFDELMATASIMGQANFVALDDALDPRPRAAPRGREFASPPRASGESCRAFRSD